MKTEDLSNLRNMFNPLIVPHSVLQANNLSLPTKIVLSHLMWLFSHDYKQPMTKWHIDNISKSLNISEFHVIAALKQLHKNKIIKWIPNISVEVI